MNTNRSLKSAPAWVRIPIGLLFMLPIAVLTVGSLALFFKEPNEKVNIAMIYTLGTALLSACLFLMLLNINMMMGKASMSNGFSPWTLRIGGVFLLALPIFGFFIGDYDIYKIERLIQGLIFLGAGIALFKLARRKEKPNIEALSVDVDDPIMCEYIAVAKAELSRFLEGLEDGQLQAFIKFPFEISGNVEHVWGIAHTSKDNIIIASLAFELINDTSQENIERLSVPLNDIEDWMLTNSKGENQGGYTMLAMAKIYERDYGKLPKRYAKDLEYFVDFKFEGMA